MEVSGNMTRNKEVFTVLVEWTSFREGPLIIRVVTIEVEDFVEFSESLSKFLKEKFKVLE